MSVGPAKVRLRCNSKEDQRQLSGSRCIYHISVGQYYHEGEKLEATFQRISKTFAHCDIMLCDTLQRHTLAFCENIANDEDAYACSLRNGDEWIARNQHYIDQIKIPHTFYRWDTWLHHPDYPKQRAIINQLFEEDPKFNAAVLITINRFLERCYARNSMQRGDYSFHLAKSLEYLKEESAIILPIWAQRKAEFIIYPQKRSAALEYVYTALVKPHFPQYLRGVALKFTRSPVPENEAQP
jgi:tRNA-dependent cyclodipeptide synthase